MRLGWLPPSGVDAWRQGRIPSLETAVTAGLRKISTTMYAFRRWAQQRGLQPSETAYVSRSRDRRPLRFSLSGDPAIERAYRTHWVSRELSDTGYDDLRVSGVDRRDARERVQPDVARILDGWRRPPAL